MATETTMMGSMSVDSLDSDSDSEDEHMAGMFTAERISALSCNIGAELLVSARYVRNPSSTSVEAIPDASIHHSALQNRDFGHTYDRSRALVRALGSVRTIFSQFSSVSSDKVCV
jgi:hypothetical protein